MKSHRRLSILFCYLCAELSLGFFFSSDSNTIFYVFVLMPSVFISLTNMNIFFCTFNYIVFANICYDIWFKTVAPSNRQQTEVEEIKTLRFPQGVNRMDGIRHQQIRGAVRVEQFEMKLERRGNCWRKKRQLLSSEKIHGCGERRHEEIAGVTVEEDGDRVGLEADVWLW